MNGTFTLTATELAILVSGAFVVGLGLCALVTACRARRRRKLRCKGRFILPCHAWLASFTVEPIALWGLLLSLAISTGVIWSAAHLINKDNQGRGNP